ncbi:uncharacterized protein LOC111272719 isoform X2 [Varroa jacobsoni]|uniref:uncharacterized protein LOC111272719 isoform X2 n=1 Tax=Varroa jacobsoni TaxID=62625 RepID=UPI000BF646FE|nr:uncharacterized protein LOC111272719 isoform X2 [Varroa jacobsoni]
MLDAVFLPSDMTLTGEIFLQHARKTRANAISLRKEIANYFNRQLCQVFDSDNDTETVTSTAAKQLRQVTENPKDPSEVLPTPNQSISVDRRHPGLCNLQRHSIEGISQFASVRLLRHQGAVPRRSVPRSTHLFTPASPVSKPLRRSEQDASLSDPLATKYVQ